MYAGPDAELRQAAEHRALTLLQSRFPVPHIASTGRGWVATEYVDGVHGQDLVTTGHARSVLAECGRLLRQLHSFDPRLLNPAAAEGSVIQHGDFGPNNLLFDSGADRAVAVLDWEFSGTGPAITDLAWCEWIIRMHHPDAIAELSAFFAAYGSKPPWSERHDEMVRRCRSLEEFTRRWVPAGPGITQWQERTRTVEAWRE